MYFAAACTGRACYSQCSTSTSIYAHATRAYRPIEYSYLRPFASLTRTDPKLQDPKAYNVDLGWRGSLGDAMQFDVGIFELVSGVDPSGEPFIELTNVATGPGIIPGIGRSVYAGVRAGF